MIDKILPSSVITVVATPEMWEQACYPEEWELVKNAVSKRQNEFQAGRNCARKALKKLGIENFPLLSGNKRQPLWPKNIIGSITHCGDYCAAALYQGSEYVSIGIDVEEKTALEKDSLDLVCTANEKLWLKETNLTNTFWSKVFFCAKECIYKCYYPLTHNYLDFLEAELKLNPKDNTFHAELLITPPESFNINRNISGKFFIDDKYIYTSLVI